MILTDKLTPEACQPGLTWLTGQSNPTAAWRSCVRPEWLLFAVRKLSRQDLPGVVGITGRWLCEQCEIADIASAETHQLHEYLQHLAVTGDDPIDQARDMTAAYALRSAIAAGHGQMAQAALYLDAALDFNYIAGHIAPVKICDVIRDFCDVSGVFSRMGA